MNSVTIRKGFVTYVLIIVGAFAGFWFTVGFFRVIFGEIANTNSITVGQLCGALLLTGSLSFLCLYAALSASRQKYIVSLDGVEVRRLWKPRFVAWSDVTMFGEVPTLFGVSIYFIKLADMSSVSFFVAFMARPERSAKALIEAAYVANSDIEFTFFLCNEYGKPPYGIFESR